MHAMSCQMTVREERVQARGGGQETAQAAKLLELARTYAHADWRTLRMDASNPLWVQWINTWSKGLVHEFLHVAPDLDLSTLAERQTTWDCGVVINEAAVAGAVPGSPGLPFWACAHVSCRNMDGSSERSMKTFACGGCMSARFCSKACARKAHAQHKVQCRK